MLQHKLNNRRKQLLVDNHRDYEKNTVNSAVNGRDSVKALPMHVHR